MVTELKFYKTFSFVKKKSNSIEEIIPKAIKLAIKAIIKHGGQARLIGGAVRNLLLGLEVKDYDLASSLLPEQNILALNDVANNIIPTGMKHGTITAIIQNQAIEITTLRVDAECDGRHASVSYSQNWNEDAARRDFTINALSLDISGIIYDYYNGLSDLKKRIVRFVGDPEKRIHEDYLRILRYFRFCAFLGLKNIDLASLDSSIKLAIHLKKISKERIKQEIFQLLSMPYALNVFKLMHENKVLEYINLDLPFSINKQLDKLSFIKSNPIINLAAILRIAKFDKVALEALAKNWKMSNKENTLLKQLCLPQEFTKIPIECYKELLLSSPISLHKKWAYHLGKELYHNYISMLKVLSIGNRNRFNYLMNNKILKDIDSKSLPINGNDIINLGITNKSIKNYLQLADRIWVRSNFKISKEKLISILKNHII